MLSADKISSRILWRVSPLLLFQSLLFSQTVTIRFLMHYRGLCLHQCLLALGTLVIFMLSGCATPTRPGIGNVTRPVLLLVPAADVERLALINYVQQFDMARAQGRLVTQGRDLARLQTVGDRLIRQTGVYRDDTMQWEWVVMLIDAPVLNASCAPGGKITFFTGLIRNLQLTDDEIAAIMGHEIAHALREHGREKLSWAYAERLASIGAILASQNNEAMVRLANEAAHYLWDLPNSREQESEADTIGLELAARAGYDPRAAITVWRKMEAATRGQHPPEFLSTHPAPETRMSGMTELLPKVLPLYESAGQSKSSS